MLKNRSDFPNEKEYKKYTKTSDFLLNYSWENKTESEIIKEMALPDFEQEFLPEAMEVLGRKKDFSGMSLDRFILNKLNESEDDFNQDEVIFLERDD